MKLSDTDICALRSAADMVHNTDFRLDEVVTACRITDKRLHFGSAFSILRAATRLAGEAGEFCNEIGKVACAVGPGFELTEEQKKRASLELFDAFWYILKSLREIDVSPQKMLELGFTKLADKFSQDRQELENVEPTGH
jgi:hypothetical protein